MEASIIRVSQAHECAARAAVFDLMQSLKLADAMVDVDDVIPRLQFRKIAEEAGRLGAALRCALQHGFKNVSGPEDGDMRVEKHYAIRERCAAQHNRGNA